MSLRREPGSSNVMHVAIVESILTLHRSQLRVDGEGLRARHDNASEAPPMPLPQFIIIYTTGRETL
jgi:hypothetical protein